MSHTPGPWVVDGVRVNASNIDPGPDHETEEHGLVKGTRNMLALVYGRDEKKNNQAENARLIAAAPDLLAALKEAQYAIEIAERYLGKAVADGELSGCAIPVEHALKTIEGRNAVVKDAIRKAEGQEVTP